MWNDNTILYIIINLFETYIIWRFMRIFYDQNRTSKPTEIASFILFFLGMSALSLFVSIPLLYLAYCVVGYFSLSFNYTAAIRTRILSSILIYVVLVLMEGLVALLTGLIDIPYLSEYYYSSVPGLITAKILSFIVVLVLENYKNIKKGCYIVNSYWAAVFLIPLGSLFLLLALFKMAGLQSNLGVLCCAILLLINVFIFYILDRLNLSFEEKVKTLLLEKQNLLYEQQFELMNRSANKIKSVRHDLKNHLFELDTLLQAQKEEEAQLYIEKLMQNLYADQEYSHCGNLTIDSILNYKSQEAEQKGISINLDVQVPMEFSIDNFDLVVILGNLLDNAIEAVSDLLKGGHITVKIKITKGKLSICVENPFSGSLIYSNGVILTSKEDRENHGIGLYNIKNIVKKYDGDFKTSHTADRFIAEVWLYLS